MKNIIAYSFIIICITSCQRGKNEIGQYIYEDCANTVHIASDCLLSYPDKTKEERYVKYGGLKYMRTDTLTGIYWAICPKCIDDEAYSKLVQIVRNNPAKPLQNGNDTTLIY